MSKSAEPKKTLAEDLDALIHEYAEYSHPCDYDEKRLDRATGVVSIHTLRELLAKHSE